MGFVISKKNIHTIVVSFLQKKTYQMVIKGSANFDPPQVHFLPLSLLLLSPTPRFCRTKETRSEGEEGEKDLFWLSSSFSCYKTQSDLTHTQRKEEGGEEEGGFPLRPL